MQELCATGTAIQEPESNRPLVTDCAVLLGLKDALVATTTLNRSGDVAIEDWDGVTVGGTRSVWWS